MNSNWRVILDSKHYGHYNMAADEAIFLSYQKLAIPTLRIYGWNGPFLTLGYNQNVNEVLIDDQRLPFVRRITGGAAILHDQELTYSLICSRQDLDLPINVKQSYKKICAFLVEFYQRLGLKAQFADQVFSDGQGLSGYGNFCFASIEDYDLLVGGRKLGGNAQKLSKDIIFQQGSIPLALDFDLINRVVKRAGTSQAIATALNPLTGKQHDYEQLVKLLAESFQSTFNVKNIYSGLLHQELMLCEKLTQNKYGSKEWNYHKKTGLVE